MTDEGFINLIRRARELLTDVQIATRLRVSVPSIDRWARARICRTKRCGMACSMPSRPITRIVK